jgi:hypothetical protein
VELNREGRASNPRGREEQEKRADETNMFAGRFILIHKDLHWVYCITGLRWIQDSIGRKWDWISRGSEVVHKFEFGSKMLR